MISFIIIGRNEGWKLPKCIESIKNTAIQNNLKAYEIIYVDSDSSDDSISEAKKNKLVKVFQIKGDINAAIARNIGAEFSIGKVLFFIDGDMEIIPDFLKIVYSEDNGLIKDFVSGHWVNYFYDYSGNLINKEAFQNRESDVIKKVTGGLFLINKETWNLIGGMNNEFEKSEDADLGLRLAKKGIFLLRKKEIAAIHHTISYLDKKRMWKDLWSMSHIYGRSFLYRRHFFNKYIYDRIITHDHTAILLLIVIISLFFSTTFGTVIFVFYMLSIFFRGKFGLKSVLYYFIRDLSVIVGIFVFFPKRNVFKYKKV